MQLPVNMQRYMVLVNGNVSSSKPKVIALIECVSLSAQEEGSGKSAFTVRPFAGSEQQSWRDSRDACTIFKYRNLHYFRFSDWSGDGEEKSDSSEVCASTIYVTLNSTRYSIAGHNTKVLFGGILRSHFPTLDIHYGVGGVELWAEARLYVNLSPHSDVLIDLYAKCFHYTNVYSQRALAYQFLFSGHSPQAAAGPSRQWVGGYFAASSCTRVAGVSDDSSVEHIIYHNIQDILTSVALLKGVVTSQQAESWDMNDIQLSVAKNLKATLDLVIVMTTQMHQEKKRIIANPNRTTVSTTSKYARIVIASLAGPQIVVVFASVMLSGVVALKVGSKPFTILPKRSEIRVNSGQVLFVIDKYFGLVIFKEDQPDMQVNGSAFGRNDNEASPGKDAKQHGASGQAKSGADNAAQSLLESGGGVFDFQSISFSEAAPAPVEAKATSAPLAPVPAKETTAPLAPVEAKETPAPVKDSSPSPSPIPEMCPVKEAAVLAIVPKPSSSSLEKKQEIRKSPTTKKLASPRKQEQALGSPLSLKEKQSGGKKKTSSPSAQKVKTSKSRAIGQTKTKLKHSVKKEGKKQAIASALPVVSLTNKNGSLRKYGKR